MKTNNTPSILDTLEPTAIRVAAAALLSAKYFDEYFTPETANVEYLRNMLEDAIISHQITATQLNEAASQRPRIFGAHSTDPQVLTTSTYWHTDNFTVVGEFPAGAIVWNIGRKNFPFPGFIPVAYQMEEYTIDRARLMAVRCKDEKTADKILKTAGRKTIGRKEFDALNA